METANDWRAEIAARKAEIALQLRAAIGEVGIQALQNAFQDY